MSYSSKWKTTIMNFRRGRYVPPGPPKRALLIYCQCVTTNFILKYLSFTCLKSFLSVHVNNILIIRQKASLIVYQRQYFLLYVVKHLLLIFNLLICLLLFVCQLPRAKDTAAFSGGGLKRFVKSVGDTMFHLTTKMSESDQVCFNLIINSKHQK